MIEVFLSLILIVAIVAHITWIFADGHAAVTRYELEEEIRRLKDQDR
jgi:hypothetical protein